MPRSYSNATRQLIPMQPTFENIKNGRQSPKSMGRGEIDNRITKNTRSNGDTIKRLRLKNNYKDSEAILSFDNRERLDTGYISTERNHNVAMNFAQIQVITKNTETSSRKEEEE